MARFFQALVVLGGSLVGCSGRDSDDLGTTASTDDTTGPRATSEADAGAGAVEGDDTLTEAHDPSPSPTDPSQPPINGAARRGPEDCPSALWDCGGGRACRYEDAPTCGVAWNGDIDRCLEHPLEECRCAPELNASASDCVAGQVLTCIAGAFEAADGETAAFEKAYYECRCVERAATCGETCTNHGVGEYGRACLEADDLVVCGGCIFSGILR